MVSDKPEASSNFGHIRRLPPEVVNRIAAGEVVVRPSAALKEILENSLDAGAKSIIVTVREGGLKLLNVTDDGSGIPQADLPLLCERFATSKLSQFTDLEEVATFGFRGEALASISHIARLSVLTKTAASEVAYKASYVDGKLRDAPQATAGVDGTTISVEDMFYNIPTRKMGIRSPSDEYRSIVEVVSRYAIRYSDVSFICRKQQTGNSRIVAGADVRTEVKASVKDNIRTAFGSAVANELISFSLSLDGINVKISAHVSSANFSMKKGIFVLFINGRLVESAPLRRAIWAAYGMFLPKNGHPFVYVDLVMKQADIDVNVHPTKKEIRFLHETVIIEAFVEMLSEKLKTTETSRTFLTQSVIVKDNSTTRLGLQKPSDFECSPDIVEPMTVTSPNDDEPAVEDSSSLLSDERSKGRGSGEEVADARSDGQQAISEEVIAIAESDSNIADVESIVEVDPSTFTGKRARSELSGSQQQRSEDDPVREPVSKKPAVYAKDKIRTGSDAPVGLMDAFVARDSEPSPAVGIRARRRRRATALPMLTSVRTMLDKLQKGFHKGLSQIFKEHLFVGLASSKYALVQHSTKLLLVELEPVVTQLMYHQVLMRFSDHEVFVLNPPAPMERLIDRYVKALPTGLYDTLLSAESCASVLFDKAQMLSDYYGISIGGANAKTSVVCNLPLLLPGVMPDLESLGKFLYHLAVDTDWFHEAPCLQAISNSIAEWYGRHWIPMPSQGSPQGAVEEVDGMNNTQQSKDETDEDDGKSARTDEEQREWVVQHILFSSLRYDFYPSRLLHSRNVVRELTSTARLYKVFERC